MRTSAKVDLVFHGGSDAELRDIASKAARQFWDVRWWIDENGVQELRVRAGGDDARELLGRISETFYGWG
jgi:hypothetical protein